MEENSCQPKMDSFGPDSSDGVDGLSPTAEPNEEVDVSDSETESEDEVEHEREAIPDGDTNADSRALLDLSKSRLQKQPQVGDEDATSNNENDMVPEGADELIVHGRGHVEGKSIEPDEASPVIKDQAYYIELAMKDRNEAEVKAKDEGAEYLRRVTEEKVEQVEKPKQDDDVAAEGAHSLSTREADTSQSQQSQALLPPKATLSRGPARSENQELWALLNYSKKRLETGATPQIKKKGSVRGDDVSVSSKLSKSSKASKRSLGSKTSTTRTADIAIVGGPDNLASPLGSSDRATGKTDAPFNNVTDNGDASVDGSVSLDSETKISDRSDNSDDEEETSSDEEQEEEDELPDFLQDNDIDKTDPEETKLLYEAAKFKAASILSVSEDKLTDLQMLQALAVAEDAARKGEDKFSTKRSLFKLNEAKIEDLKSFLSLGSSAKSSQKGDETTKEEREAVGWGIGRGRFIKKVGAVFQDIKERCDEIDEQKKQEREGQPSNKEVVSAALLDLRAQVAEYEKIVAAGGRSAKR